MNATDRFCNRGNLCQIDFGVCCQLHSGQYTRSLSRFVTLKLLVPRNPVGSVRLFFQSFSRRARIWSSESIGVELPLHLTQTVWGGHHLSHVGQCRFLSSQSHPRPFYTFFEAMFSLVQPPNATSSASDELTVVEVTEDSLTLDHLLRYCYPTRNPVLGSLEVLDSVLGAAIKYTLETELVLEELRVLTRTKPLHAFVVSCRHRCEDEARYAAETLMKTAENWPATADTFAETSAARCFSPEMRHPPAGIYFRLIQFVTSGGKDVNRLCDPPKEMKGSDETRDSNGDDEDNDEDNNTDGENAGHEDSETDDSESDDEDDDEDAATKFPFNQPNADIVLRSTDGVDFKVHRFVVEMQIIAYPIFPLQAVLFSTPLTNTYVDGLPVIQTREPSSILRLLLQWCYPGTPETNIACWEIDFFFSLNTVSAIAAAQRYGMSHIVQTIKTMLMMNLYVDYLAAFCVGYSLGWFDIIQDSPRAMAGMWLPDEYHPTLEILTAAEYHSLLEYWHTYQERAYAISERFWHKDSKVWRKERWRGELHGRTEDFVRSLLVEAEMHKVLGAKEKRTPYAFNMRLLFESERMSRQLSSIDDEVRAAMGNNPLPLLRTFSIARTAPCIDWIRHRKQRPSIVRCTATRALNKGPNWVKRCTDYNYRNES